MTVYEASQRILKEGLGCWFSGKLIKRAHSLQTSPLYKEGKNYSSFMHRVLNPNYYSSLDTSARLISVSNSIAARNLVVVFSHTYLDISVSLDWKPVETGCVVTLISIAGTVVNVGFISIPEIEKAVKLRKQCACLLQEFVIYPYERDI